jgi:hypothetical protein
VAPSPAIGKWDEMTETERQATVDLYRAAWDNGSKYPSTKPK